MIVSTDDTFSLVWWNTSLSPKAKRRKNETDAKYRERRDLVRRHLFYMITELNIDLIALCEVSSEDVKVFESTFSKMGYGVKNGVRKKASQLQFDTCFIYNYRTISWQGRLIDLYDSQGETNFRVAQRSTVSLLKDMKIHFHIFASHWASRMVPNRSRNEPYRIALARSLRDKVNQLKTKYKQQGRDKDDIFIILLGDYNDEPFDTNLFNHLGASPDRGLVQDYSYLFYNPFWKSMVDESFGARQPSCCGTYFNRSGKFTRWHTFDQMMFSSTFLTSRSWRLVEEDTRVLFIPDYAKRVIRNVDNFDHMPIMARVRKD